MSRPLHRCDDCGKRRVNVCVVGGRDLCPECAKARRAAMNARPKLTPGRRHALAALLHWDGGSCAVSNVTSIEGGFLYWQTARWLVDQGYARRELGSTGEWLALTAAGRELAMADAHAVERGVRKAPA